MLTILKLQEISSNFTKSKDNENLTFQIVKTENINRKKMNHHRICLVLIAFFSG